MKRFMCLLVLGCIAFASDIIPFEQVENLAQRFITQRFGYCKLSEVLTYYSFDDAPGAYAFVFRDEADTPHTIVMGARYTISPVNEVTNVLPRSKTMFNNVLRRARSLNSGEPVFQRVYYFGPGDEYCAFDIGGREYLVNACDYHVIDKQALFSNIPEPNEELERLTRQKWDKYFNAPDFAARDSAYIPNVPFLDWVYGCGPCAASMLFWYYDEFAPSVQYGKLVDYFFTHWDYPEGEWNNAANVNREIALASNCDTMTGATYPSTLLAGMITVANSWHGYSCSGYNSPQGHAGNRYVFSYYRTNIDAQRPFVYAVWNLYPYVWPPQAGHAITAVGYLTVPGDTFTQIHNTWDNDEPYWPLWTYQSGYYSYNMVTTFTMGGGSVDNIFLNEWFEGGNTISGGTVIFENMKYRIKWQGQGSNIDHVKLAYSTGRNGEAYDTTQWTVISNNVPVGDGEYIWTCPVGNEEVRWNIIGLNSGNTRLAADGNFGFYSVNALTHTAGIDLVGHIPAPRYGGWMSDMQVSGDYVFIAGASDGFHVVDISDPTIPDLIAGLSLPGDACCIDISGNYAYVGDAEDTLRVIDISNPANPSQVGKVAVGAEALDVVVIGDYAYVAARSAGLVIVDISTPSAPSIEGQYNTTGFSYDVCVDGNYAYVADATRGIRIIDVSDPANPAESGYYDTNGIAYGVTKAGNYVYVADGNQGIKVFDASSTDTLVLLGSLDTPTIATKVAYVDDGLFVADGDFGGIRVIDVSNPNTPSEVGDIESMGSAENLRVYGSTVYLADGIIGVLIIDQDLYGIIEQKADVVQATMMVCPSHMTIDRTMIIALTTNNQVQTDVRVFDCTGRCVETVYHGLLPSGENRLSWRPENLSAGIYFIKAETGASTHLQKVVFVK